MPIHYLSSLTAKPRSKRSNLHIGVFLTVVAGALNAGGFLAVGQYTSHMTGMVSLFADQLILSNFALATVAVISWLAFFSGAATAALLVNYKLRSGSQHAYAYPLMIEAICVLAFGSFGGTLESTEIVQVSAAVIILCFAMGLQNALITKISNAEIRTTHVTGLTTDLGIEVGKLIYWNRMPGNANLPMVKANREKMRIHGILIGTFLCGGILGAIGFKFVGFASTIPLAITLGFVAMAPTMLKVKQ
jgi:uncharacterized membrane protein YoaK (UPF0700 family)